MDVTADKIASTLFDLVAPRTPSELPAGFSFRDCLEPNQSASPEQAIDVQRSGPSTTPPPPAHSQNAPDARSKSQTRSEATPAGLKASRDTSEDQTDDDLDSSDPVAAEEAAAAAGQAIPATQKVTKKSAKETQELAPSSPVERQLGSDAQPLKSARQASSGDATEHSATQINPPADAAATLVTDADTDATESAVVPLSGSQAADGISHAAADGEIQDATKKHAAERAPAGSRRTRHNTGEPEQAVTEDPAAGGKSKPGQASESHAIVGKDRNEELSKRSTEAVEAGGSGDEKPDSDKRSSAKTEDVSVPASDLSAIQPPAAVDAAKAEPSREAAPPVSAAQHDVPPAHAAAKPPTVLLKAKVAHAEPGVQTTDIDPARFLHRVAKAFESAQERQTEVRLRLHPAELGSLSIEVHVQDGALSAHVQAETPEARAALVDNLPALRERLAEQGIRIEKFDVDLRDQSGRQQQSLQDQAQQQETQRAGVPRRSISRSTVLERESPSNHRAAGPGGLNVVI